MIGILELLLGLIVMINIITAGVMMLLNEDIKTIQYLLWAVLGLVILIMREF